MGFRPIQLLPFLIGLPLALMGARPVLAQSCPYAILRLETQQYVDADAVCEAARPWSEAGYQVLVFLTDARPTSEGAWFSQLDAVESEAGLRDLTQADSFEKAAIALGATTAADLPYSVSLTYGEALWDSPLDRETARVEAIKRTVRDRLASQDATWALTTGLQESFTLAGLASDASRAPQPLAGVTAPERVDSGGGNRVLAGGGLVAGGGGTVGILVLMRQRRKQLQAQLVTLQSHIANLLMGTEQLLTGGEPENTVSYQLFVEADGERYPDLTREVIGQLGQARQVLDQAFQVHSQLRDNDVTEKQSFVQKVEAWERLYLTIVGTRDRIQQMSDEDLQTLLNPALILGATPVSAGLSTQLQIIQRHIQDTPLKVKLMRVKPDGTDAEGILGLIERVDATISRLRQAVAEAPKQWAATQARRQQLPSRLPASLGLSEAQVFNPVDETLAEAEIALNREHLYITVLDRCATANQVFDHLDQLITTFQTHDSQQQNIQTITAAGYRPPELPPQQGQVKSWLIALQDQLCAGQYGQSVETLAQLAAATHRAQIIAADWQSLHQRNQDIIQALEQETQRLITLAQGQTTTDWAALQAYPPSNWQDLDGQLDQAQKTLATLKAKALPELHQHNSLGEQQFEVVGRGAEAVKHPLETVTTTLQRLADRCQQVRHAEAHLREELSEIEGYATAVKRFVTKKLLGLIATAPPDERLQQAANHVANAYSLASQREYHLACAQQDQALRTLLYIYLGQLRDRAAEVRSLVNDADAHGQGRNDFNDAAALMAADADIRNATGKTLFTQYENANQARQELATAERMARQAIRRSEANRRNRSSGSFSSSASQSLSRRSSSSSHRSPSSRSSSSSGSSRRSSSSRGGSRRR
ncbi:MAG: hypothetical protein O3A14_05345 [Cyanobacteria bacterium]|nr:hypothetical protein [Cyanobacteriota bacterium]